MGQFKPLYTVAHVMAEVSNLTDLNGRERIRARHVLAAAIAILEEPHVSSRKASTDSTFKRLGLTDAAISVAAREYKCGVLTDDFDLYLELEREGLTVTKFSHLREINWTLP
jgi:rRNA-processing protein FCF1